MRCSNPPPRDTLGYIFYMHACPQGVLWSDVRERCLKAVDEARKRNIRVFVSGNDSRYVVGAMAKSLGIKTEEEGKTKKKGKGGSEILLDVLGEFFRRDMDDQKHYAMPNLFRATYYENDRSLKDVEMKLTGTQVALSYCGALLTYVGDVYRGLEGQIYLLADVENPVYYDVLQILERLVEKYREAPIKEAGFALKRLYLSACVDRPIEPVELFIARGNRATLVATTRFMLYDLPGKVREDLMRSMALLSNDKVFEYATKLATLLELFFESTYRQSGGKKYRRVEWLYEAGRMLESLANMKTEERDTAQVKRYAEIVLPALKNLIHEAMLEI